MDSIPGPYILAEWAEAERHLGPRLARRAWRGARAKGYEWSKRPTAEDPDRAFSLPFYLSAGCAAPGPSEHATPLSHFARDLQAARNLRQHRTRHLVRLRTLTQGPGPTLGPGTSRSLTTQFTISMSQEEKTHLEAEGKQVRVSAGDR